MLMQCKKLTPKKAHHRKFGPAGYVKLIHMRPMALATAMLLASCGTDIQPESQEAWYEREALTTEWTVETVVAAERVSLIVTTDHALWATGYGVNGNLGDGMSGDNHKRNEFSKVLDDVASVSASLSHSLAIKLDGSLWGMGENFYGELGDSTRKLRDTPVWIADDVGAAEAGGGYTLVLKNDHTLWASGSNNEGQLGIGSLYGAANAQLATQDDRVLPPASPREPNNPALTS